MKFFRVRDEGGDAKNGFNFYPLSSRQFGFLFKWYAIGLYFRYSKNLKRARIYMFDCGSYLYDDHGNRFYVEDDDPRLLKWIRGETL